MTLLVERILIRSDAIYTRMLNGNDAIVKLYIHTSSNAARQMVVTLTLWGNTLLEESLVLVSRTRRCIVVGCGIV